MPVLYPKRRYGEGDAGGKPGEWERRQATELVDLSDSLETASREKEPEYLNVEGIPDVWAHPLLFELALYDDKHPLHSRILGEWRGLLALFALREWMHFTLGLDPVHVPEPDGVPQKNDVDEHELTFPDVLGKLTPKRTLFNNTSWSNLYVILFDNAPIGVTSPMTLVCTAKNYYNRIKRVRWFDGKFLKDPSKGDYLQPDEKQALVWWLKEIQGRLNEEADGGKLNQSMQQEWNRLLRLVDIFQTDLGGVSGSFELSLGELNVTDNSMFRVINSPVKALPIDVSKSHVRLIPQGKQPGTTLLIIDPSIPEQWGMSKSTLTVYGTMTMADLPFGGLGSNRRELSGVQLIDVEWRNPIEDFFTDKLYLVEQSNAFPGAMMPEGAETIRYRSAPATPILPITTELLHYLSPESLRNTMRFESSSDGNVVTAVLSLPLSGPDAKGKVLRAKKEYRLQDNGIVPLSTNLPVLELWPNFKNHDWKVYYTYFSTAEQTTFYAKPYPLVPPQGKNDSPRRIERREELVTEITQTVQFPEAMECFHQHNKAGVLLLQLPQQLPQPLTKTWTVGVDFGTTGTNVYVNPTDGSKPRPIVFNQRLLLSVTKTPQRSRLYDEFLPSEKQETPFLSLFHNFEREAQQNGFLNPLIDGHIYFLPASSEEGFDVTREGIVTDLKWSDSRRGRNFTRAFLKQLCLQCAAEAVWEGTKTLDFRFSYPAAFSNLDIQQFGDIWEQISQEVCRKTGLTQGGSDHELESIASARYFAISENALFASGTVCIDIGGKTSDISVWQRDEKQRPGEEVACWHASLQFAGREIFGDLLYANLQFVSELCGGEIAAKLANVKNQRDKGSFYALLDALIHANGEEWLRQRTLISGNDEYRGFLHLISVGFAGLYYYVGLLLRYLHQAGKYHPEMPDVYLAGNGAKILNWLAPGGKYNSESPINALFKVVLLQASGFEANPKEFRVEVSPRPKHEAAYGLVCGGRKLGYPQNCGVLAGEAFEANGQSFDWTEMLTVGHYANQLQLTGIQQLEDFVDTFNDSVGSASGIIDRPIVINDSKREIKRRLDEQIAAESRNAHKDFERIARQGQSATAYHPEPLFIHALKTLLAVKAEQWARGSLGDVSEAAPPMNKELRDMREAYNTGVDDSDLKYQFQERYQPIRVGVANATARRRDSKIPPEFKTDEAGDYYAVAIEGKVHYAIVPRHDLTLQEHSYSPGVVGDVFDCPDFNPRLRYQRVKVTKPAFFEPDAKRQLWTLKHKGELNLGRGE